MSENTSLPPEDKLKLKSWGLPKNILQNYASRGVSSMFVWQAECLTSGSVLSGGNLVYSAPTSAGKTLVAEILAIQTVLERQKKVVIILPFVSVVREKMLYLQSIVSGSGIKVEGFMGSYNPPGGFKLVHIAVCTIEKANSLINRLIEEDSLDEIGCVVIDEIHLLGDPHRGYLLELLLTKLKYMSETNRVFGIQIIGMSATLPNLNVLADWLNGTLYCTDFRPIPLTEFVKVGNRIYSTPDLCFSHSLEPTVRIKNDAEDVIYLCVDTVLNGYSTIVFCPTKNWCETLAKQISAEIKRLGFEKSDVGNAIRQELNSSAIADTLEQLKRCPVGLDKTLGCSVSFGVAYHHAGLTLDERDIIEGAFKQNILRVLVATSTLSSGVNLPARRVIIRTPTFNGRCMDILTYRQMIGRAGRKGRDTAGESFLICSESEKQYAEHLVRSSLPPIESCLVQGNLTSSLKRAILEVIACGVVTNRNEVEHYTKCTLLSASVDSETIRDAINSCIDYLETNEFISLREDGEISASSLAEACLSASIQPDQGLKLLRELHQARKCFVLHTDLHAIYQVTPYSICDQWTVDWMKVFSVWEDLPEHMRAVGELVGVEDRFLIRAMRSNINMNSVEQAHKISVHKRFYTSLALQDLINEVPLKKVAVKYGCNKGTLQSLQQSASTFAGMVHNFCKRLGWGCLEVIVAELARRIQFGVHRDLLELLRLDCLSAHHARALFNAGIKTLPDLASSGVRDVEKALMKATPFHSENMNDVTLHKNVWILGRSGMTELEAADIFIHEARRFLLKEMGVKEASWSDGKSIDSAQDSSSMQIIDTDRSSYTECVEAGNEISVDITQNNERLEDGEKFEKIEIDKTPSEKGSRPKFDTPESRKEAESKNLNPNPREGINNVSSNDLFDPFDDIELNFDLTGVEKRTSVTEIPETEETDFGMEDDGKKFSDVVSNRVSVGGKDTPENADEVMLNYDAKSSTPVVTFPETGKGSDFTPSGTNQNTSMNDIFFDSPLLNSSSLNGAFARLLDNEGQVIDELDSNWGGDSLLEASIILEESVDKTSLTAKRKRDDFFLDPCAKKICRSTVTCDSGYVNSCSSADCKLTKSEAALDESIQMNTQLVGLLDTSSHPSLQNRIEKYTVKPVSECNSVPAKLFSSSNSTANEILHKTKANEEDCPFEKKKEEISRMIESLGNLSDGAAATAGKTTGKSHEFSESFFRNAFDSTFNSSSLGIANPGGLYLKKSSDDQSKNDRSPLDTEAVGEVIGDSQEPSFILSRSQEKCMQSKGDYKILSTEPLTKLVHSGASITKATKKDALIDSQSEKILSPGAKMARHVCGDLATLKQVERSAAKCSRLAFALETVDSRSDIKSEQRIGAKIMGRKWRNNQMTAPDFSCGAKAVIGAWITWGLDVYYFDLRDSGCTCVPFLKNLLSRSDLTLCCYDIKNELSLLYKCCGFVVRCRADDVAVSDWMLHPEDKSKSVGQLV